MHFRWIAILGGVLLLGGSALLFGRRSDTPVTITNHSAIGLRDVVIAGSGFTHTFDRIAPGATVETGVEPHGETGLSLRFKAGDRVVALGEAGYFEGGGAYKVAVEVRPDLSATIDGHLNGIPN